MLNKKRKELTTLVIPTDKKYYKQKHTHTQQTHNIR